MENCHMARANRIKSAPHTHTHTLSHCVGVSHKKRINFWSSTSWKPQSPKPNYNASESSEMTAVLVIGLCEVLNVCVCDTNCMGTMSAIDTKNWPRIPTSWRITRNGGAFKIHRLKGWFAQIRTVGHIKIIIIQLDLPNACDWLCFVTVNQVNWVWRELFAYHHHHHTHLHIAIRLCWHRRWPLSICSPFARRAASLCRFLSIYLIAI